MTTMTTPRKTRAPRAIPSDFHISPGIAVTTTATMRDRIDALCAAYTAKRAETNKQITNPIKLDPRRKKKEPTVSRSSIIRTALLHFARKVKTTQVPADCLPPADPEAQVHISSTIPNKSDRDLYISLARSYGITMSELTLRCLHEFLNYRNALPILLEPKE